MVHQCDFNCSDSEPTSPTTTRSAPTLEEQAQEVKRLRSAIAHRQVETWQGEANTPMLDASTKFSVLLGEACRHELHNIRHRRGPRYQSLTDGEACMMRSDVKETYQRLVREAKRMFEQRRQCGCTDTQLQQIGAQAIASFSALYPWSDGITCRDMESQHSHYSVMLSRRSVDAKSFQDGRTYAVMSSFSAAMPLSQVKLQAASLRREYRMDLYKAAAMECQQQEQQIVGLSSSSLSSEELSHILPEPSPSKPSTHLLTSQAEVLPAGAAPQSYATTGVSRKRRNHDHTSNKRTHHHHHHSSVPSSTEGNAMVKASATAPQPTATNITAAARIGAAMVTTRTLAAC